MYQMKLHEDKEAAKNFSNRGVRKERVVFGSRSLFPDIYKSKIKNGIIIPNNA